MTRKAVAKSESLLVKQTSDGLHLANSILWLDAQDSGDLSFLSSATVAHQPRVPQVIATEETVKILEALRKKPQALVCQYNRPFSIGRLRMELLPSGCVLGGASLYLETDKGRLLYAPQLQPHRVSTVRQMQLKRAYTLILGASQPDPNYVLPNRKKEKERLLEAALACLARGQDPLVLCDQVATAQELTKLFCDTGLAVAVHETIFKLNNVYEAYGSKLGPYSRYNRRHTRQKVMIFPLPGRRGWPLRAVLPQGPLLVVDGTAEESLPPSPYSDVVGRFVIASSCDGTEIREIITAVSPRELYVFGPYAKRYVDELQGICPVIRPLFPNDQPTLF